MIVFDGKVIDNDSLSIIISYLPLLIVSALASVPMWKNVYIKLQDKKYIGVLEIAFCAIVLLLCTASLVNQSYTPFLYFRF